VIERGKVVSIHEGRALILLTPRRECSQCGLCSQLRPGGKMSLEVEAIEGLHPGQEVTIEIDSREILKGGWTVFILPLIAFLLGAVAAPDLMRIIGLRVRSDVASILVGSLLLGATFLGIYLRSRNPKRREKLTPKIVDVQ
jgi:positive regulator of sigma E activity